MLGMLQYSCVVWGSRLSNAVGRACNLLDSDPEVSDHSPVSGKVFETLREVFRIPSWVFASSHFQPALVDMLVGEDICCGDGVDELVAQF